MLARAARFESEVAAHLVRRGFATEVVDGALQALRDLRYVDDAMLARRRAEDLLLRRGCGRLRVTSELTRRGVADSVTETAIVATLAIHSESELARKALRRRFDDPSALSAADRARAFRFLLARGHPVEIVSDVLGTRD
jgi:regulatory protein